MARQAYRVLVADEDASYLKAYRRLLARAIRMSPTYDDEPAPVLDIVSCRSVEEALGVLSDARDAAAPFQAALISARLLPRNDPTPAVKALAALDPHLILAVITDAEAPPDRRYDRAFLLRRPFDRAEVEGLGTALAAKWHAEAAQRRTRAELNALNKAFRMVNAELQRHLKLLRQREEELDHQNMLFTAALNNMRQGLCMFDQEARLIVCNAPYAAMYGLPEELTQEGTPLSAIIEHRARSGHSPREPNGPYEASVAGARAGKAASYRLPLVDGRTIQISHQPLPSGGWVATHEDVTESIAAEARIAHMARHDALTGLPNRTHLREKMEDALARVRRGESMATLCLDLDHFKAVNDTLGHPVGDALLCAVTERLIGCVRETDTVARLGGDEFAILQPGLDRPEQAGRLAHRLIDTLSKPYDLDGHQVVIGASIGIAFAPTDGVNADTLLKNADMALYRAKTDGRGTFRYFEPEMDARLQRRRALELDLRKALTQDEFELFYQALVDVQTEEVNGFEALLRWRHPTRGMIPPSDFVPLAEEIGLIVPLGEWVVRQACAEAARWPRPVKVAVNLSPAQFRSRTLVHTVVSALDTTGLAPQRLELEITESVLLQDNEATLATLHQLRGLGVRIAMDDFGTGYSSLSYLRSFPFDKIKIDRSFVSELAEKSDCMAIVRAVASLGASLGMVTTAEGVETVDQLRQVREQGCTEVQGYLFSQPRPASELADLLQHPRRMQRVA